ncbi:hypothetical protein [Chryseobacterium sp.]|uniref:hypothetical protein n=1 Tax=Chryseobacterium sp. TaxID=1871047 RepID=UPI00289C1A32|nr:hypothetical protein [Chryseobacterium sp.]
MKNKIILFSAILTSFLAFGQNEKNVHSEMDVYAKKIDSIIVSEKFKMNIELDKLDKDFKGKAAAEEKQKKKAEIAEKYQNILNEKIENQKGILEDSTKEMVKNIVLNPDKRYGVVVDPQTGLLGFTRKRVKLPKDYLHSVRFIGSFVFSSLTSEDKPFGYFNKDSDVKRSSRNLSAYTALRYENQIGKFTSPLFYRTGLGLRVDYFTPNNDKVFAQDGENLYLKAFTKGHLKRTLIYNTYITIPLEIRWVVNPKFTEYEGIKYIDNTNTQFYLTGGFYGGGRTGSTIYNKYSTDYTKKIVERERVMVGVNNFMAGAKIGVGYGGVALFIQKDFTPTFTNDALINNRYGLHVGLEFVSINF